jgi:hypothetical protein
MGFCPIFWDNGEHYSRSQLKFKDSQLASIFIRYKVSTTPTNTPITTSTEDINGDKAINMSDVMLIAETF